LALLLRRMNFPSVGLIRRFYSIFKQELYNVYFKFHTDTSDRGFPNKNFKMYIFEFILRRLIENRNQNCVFLTRS
jgi:hypothetical protein